MGKGGDYGHNLTAPVVCYQQAGLDDLGRELIVQASGYQCTRASEVIVEVSQNASGLHPCRQVLPLLYFEAFSPSNLRGKSQFLG